MLNIAERFAAVAAANADKVALWVPVKRRGRRDYLPQSFAESARKCDGYAHLLRRAGVERGAKVLLMVRPGFDLVPLAFALFKLGAVPVLIDPGLGVRGLLRAVRQVEPAAFIGIPAAHLLRLLSPASFRAVRHFFVIGPHHLGATRSLPRMLAEMRGKPLAEGSSWAPFPVAATAPDETAAILFTSGSTGPAKGVVYTHRIFDAQVRLLHEAYGIGPGDCDLPCFPLFGLFSTALGATAVIPHMDFTRPAKVAPRAIVEPIRRFHVTYSFGSPALWETVGAWCARRGERLPGLRRIFMSGAPAPAALHRLLLEQVLDPGAETHTPYGATESLPVADITGHEVLAETAARTAQGAGTCVGRPVPGIEVRILPITDGPLPAYPEGAELPPGEIGEIAVRGEVVTPAYYGLEEATALAKMRDAQGRLWHRIGDVGHLDAQGRLWFCGRKAHRVRTPHGPLFTITCEAIFRNHPDVHRAALVGVGDAAAAAQVPVMVIEPNPGRFPCTARRRAEFARQLLGLGAASPVTAGIRQIFFRKAFPVDIRHNAKIRREELALWAAARLGRHRGG